MPVAVSSFWLSPLKWARQWIAKFRIPPQGARSEINLIRPATGTAIHARLRKPVTLRTDRIAARLRRWTNTWRASISAATGRARPRARARSRKGGVVRGVSIETVLNAAPKFMTYHARATHNFRRTREHFSSGQ